MFKVLYWNCRGIGDTPTKMMLLHLIVVCCLDLIFLSKPKILFDSSISIGIHSFGFNFSFSNTNSSLWCFCNSSPNLNFSLLDHSNPHITIKILDRPTSSSCMITRVYGSTDHRLRRIFWDYLVNTSSIALPWYVIGDFNAIPLVSEKFTPALHPPSLSRNLMT